MKLTRYLTISLVSCSIFWGACNLTESHQKATTLPATDALSLQIKPNAVAIEIKIGHQIWSAKNLSTTHFKNGDLLPEARSAKDWEKAGEQKQPAWCFYNNDSTNEKKYGRLYNWYAVNDKRGIAPKGWHVASDEEWKTLIDSLGGLEKAGRELKNKDGWKENGNGINTIGFAAMPGGYRFKNGVFNAIDYFATFWTSTENYTYSAWFRSIRYDNTGIYRNNFGKQDGYSVRCVKD